MLGVASENKLIYPQAKRAMHGKELASTKKIKKTEPDSVH